MKRSSLIPSIAVIFILMAWLAEPAGAYLQVFPREYDFGNVEVGVPETAVITTNVGLDPYEIESVVLSGSSYFSVEPLNLPIILTPVVGYPLQATLHITVNFTPLGEGYHAAELLINGQPMVSLGGVGVKQEPASSVTVADILAFFDESVADNTPFGAGPGNSTDGRSNDLRNMIEAAGDLIEDGYIEEACRQLLDAYHRCDGEFPPPDFVAGPAAPTLGQMIFDLMAQLGC